MLELAPKVIMMDLPMKLMVIKVAKLRQLTNILIVAQEIIPLKEKMARINIVLVTIGIPSIRIRVLPKEKLTAEEVLAQNLTGNMEQVLMPKDLKEI